MLVLATNRPQELDAAILDRIDVSMKIDLPDVAQRGDLVKLYMKLHVLSSLTPQKTWFSSFQKLEMFHVDEECFSDKSITDIATSTAGFSGREISKLLIAIRYSLSMSSDRKLTAKMMDIVIADKLVEHSKKVEFAMYDEKKNSNSKHSSSSSSSSMNGCASSSNSPMRNSISSGDTNERRFNELELKLARRRNMNGEATPGVVVLNARQSAL